MPHKPIFSPDYYLDSQDVLETVLNRLSACKSWQSYDHGCGYGIDERYAMMPSLTKADIRRHGRSIRRCCLPAQPAERESGQGSGYFTA